MFPTRGCSGTAFSDAADAAFNTKLSPRFTPYLAQTNDLIFLHGAFIFEDVGVPAYQVRPCQLDMLPSGQGNDVCSDIVFGTPPPPPLP